MRRPFLVSFLSCACALAPSFPGRARAQAEAEVELERGRSDKRWALELRGGPYGPRIDDEFSALPPAERPHARYFGAGRRPMFQVEVDYQLLRDVGSLAIGLGAGYLRESARSFVAPAAGQPPGERSGDRTTLAMVPLSLSLVYRLDLLARHAGIPLVPYGKAGLDYALWSVTDGDGRTSDPPGPARGRGGTPGFHVAAGLALLLDVFDPSAARALDSEIGVNHTYLFFEYGHYALSGLGRDGYLNLGDTTWTVGLLFEF